MARTDATRARWARPSAVACVVAGALAGSSGPISEPPESTLDPKAPFALVIHPSELATRFSDRREETTEWIGVWHTMCGSPPGVASPSDLAAMAQDHEAQVGARDVFVIDTPPNGVASNFNVVFIVAATIPDAAYEALQDAEHYLEASFTDSLTVTIDVSFAPLATGILGATTPIYSTVTYKSSRTALINGRDASDTIQTFLPNTTKIGVRYSSSTTIT